MEGATRWRRRERDYEVRMMMKDLRRSPTYLGELELLLYIGYCCLTLETNEQPETSSGWMGCIGPPDH